MPFEDEPYAMPPANFVALVSLHVDDMGGPVWPDLPGPRRLAITTGIRAVLADGSGAIGPLTVEGWIIIARLVAAAIRASLDPVEQTR